MGSKTAVRFNGVPFCKTWLDNVTLTDAASMAPKSKKVQIPFYDFKNFSREKRKCQERKT